VPKPNQVNWLHGPPSRPIRYGGWPPRPTIFSPLG
jgi:hypothetical protein